MLMAFKIVGTNELKGQDQMGSVIALYLHKVSEKVVPQKNHINPTNDFLYSK